MSAADCDRWTLLSDQASAGEPLSDKDQAWLAEHASVCRDCGGEQQFYSSLREALGRPEMLVVPSAAPAGRPSSRKPLIILAWASGLAVAASLAIALGGHLGLHLALPGSRPPRPLAAPTTTTTTTTTTMSAHLLFASGEALLGLTPAEAGQPVPQGQRLSTAAGSACMGIADSIDVCLGPASAALFARSDPAQIVVYLEKGSLMARLDRQPGDRKFLVRTASAEVQAVGTRFSVHLADDGNTRVRLHEGKLAVRATNRISTALAAPVQANVAEDIRVLPISPAATGDDQPLADLVEATRGERGASLVLTSTPAGADVLVDDLAIGKTPLSVLLTAAAQVRLSLPGYRPISERIACESCGPGLQRSAAAGGFGDAPQAGERPRIERAYTLTALAAAPEGPPELPARLRRGGAVSPDQLLAKAQALRARGRYEACAHLYRRLWSEFPTSEEGKVSMISLGELELVHTKSPRTALEAFNAYLRLGGPLEREARFGKIRALRALGRSEDAEAETARFLHDYPTGIQATALRRESHAK